MIQPQELRIGDYIEYNGEIIKLDGSLLCCYIQNELEFPLNPIPLTEEILLKFGFEKKGDFWFVKSGIKIENRNNGFSYFRYLNEIKILSVHQLQNLFYSISGKELHLKTKL